MSSNLPNFLVVGAAKCGTTSIHHYLKQHPDIFMPEHKEPLFMMSEIYKNLSYNDPRRKISDQYTVFKLNDYKKLFNDVKNEKAIGEASATYLYYYQTSIPNIKKYLGDVKILIILRNPVDRAYSAYSHLRREKAENRSFEDFLELENIRKKENWDILNIPIASGLFYQQVKAYKENFNRVKVKLIDDFKQNSITAIQDLFGFLQVDESFIPDMGFIHNKSPIKKRSMLNTVLSKNNMVKQTIRKLLEKCVADEKIAAIKNFRQNLTTEKMSPETRKKLGKVFRDDIEKLENLIGRDLSRWKIIQK